MVHTCHPSYFPEAEVWRMIRKGWVWRHVPVISATAGNINRRIVVQVSPGKKQNPISKITKAARCWQLMP
jgi:hypothetical protein